MRVTNNLVFKLMIPVLGLGLWAVNSATAQPASVSGNTIHLPVVVVADQAFQIELTLVANSNPVQVLVTGAEELSEPDTSGASVFDGESLSIPSIDVEGTLYWAEFSLLSADPPTFVLADAGLSNSSPPVQNCTRPDPDITNGPDNPALVDGLLIPADEIVDGGPGPDGIPSIDSPLFTQSFASTLIQPGDLVVGIHIDGIAKAYPHSILNYHEIVNDRLTINGDKLDVTLSFCPLTGSAVLWESFAESADTSFGVSGLLYNANLILYDRETQSLWSQMLEQAISGPELARVPEKIQAVETTWATWLAMYPETFLLMIEETESSFPYEINPYGTHSTDTGIPFNANNSDDDRLHPKERVLGINVGDSSKVYPVNNFGHSLSVINDTVGNMDVVAAGSSGDNFAVIFNRQLEDCTTLEFMPVENKLPIVMIDNEGSEWDIFGRAQSGPRTGTQLQKTNSFISYWFAWTAFFEAAEIQE
ncbi:MAG: DUF3179 domain-containing protein [Gammaproteobacteria bacterium]|nr:DUF3179 domain-containing protein [Gammaproteobacteria bacterium]MDD9957311.1 DUF3179 domain-containing protein [Gammaproteobacteria bacterium]